MPPASSPPWITRLRRWLRGSRGRLLLAALGGLVVVIVAVTPELRGLERDWLASLSRLGTSTPLWFIAVYVVAPLLFLPVMPLDFAAGAHFGFWQGAMWVQSAAMISALAGWVAGRTILQGHVRRLQERRPQLRRLDDAVAAEGIRILLLCRLSSFFPFSLINLVFGAIRVPLWKYLLATLVGTLPGTLMTVYAGDMAGDLSGAPGHTVLDQGGRLLVGVGFVATVVLVVYVTRKAQKILQRSLEGPPPMRPARSGP